MSLFQILVIAYAIKFINIALCCIMVHASKDYFLYFAYGSNLLKRRIQLNNPSAVFLGAGRLNHHKLDFVNYYNVWGGAVATIVPNPREHVWGAVWKMDNDMLISLDRQEGVDMKQYFSKYVNISGYDGMQTRCRTYQHMVMPPLLKSLSSLPVERRPSITYKQCMVNGAIECHVPDDYVDMLKGIPTNGLYANDTIRRKLKI